MSTDRAIDWVQDLLKQGDTSRLKEKSGGISLLEKVLCLSMEIVQIFEKAGDNLKKMKAFVKRDILSD